MKPLLAAAFLFGILSAPVAAQFVGPSVQGRTVTVAQAHKARVGTYVVLTGRIVDHQRGDYFTFRDDSGEIRVEIESNVWRGREVTPEKTVRIMGEVDRGVRGRYIWVKSLDVI